MILELVTTLKPRYSDTVSHGGAPDPDFELQPSEAYLYTIAT